ncbi:HAMP domain-containing sensor histidine kinase [Desulfovibrio sp.]
MSSSREARWRPTSLRLTIWYAAVFFFSSVLLFGLTFFFLSGTVREQERRIVSGKIADYAAIAQNQGLDVLRDVIRQEAEYEVTTDFFLRLRDAKGAVLAEAAPLWWEGVPPGIAPGDLDENVHWFSWRSEELESELVVGARRVAGGGVLLVGRDRSDTEELLGTFQTLFVTVILFTGLLGVIGGTLLARRTLRPISDLIRTLSAIDKGRLDARVPMRGGGDELDGLVRLFNAMLDRIRTLVTGMRETLDNAAHDLRTPITRMRMGIEAALVEPEGGQGGRAALADCAEECERIATMMDTLMDISEAETGVMQLTLRGVDLSALVAEMAETYGYIAEEKGVVLSSRPGAPVAVTADAGRMRQALANLLDNAVKYTPAGGHVDISLERAPGHAVIRVRDDGPGITPEDQPRIFDRLYRCDKSRSVRGLGLGLALVRAVLTAHGGRVEVESAPGRGSAFVVTLPLVTPSRLGAAPEPRRG